MRVRGRRGFARLRAQRGGAFGLAVAALLLLGVAPVASAAEELPTGRADGVAISWKNGEMIVVFGKSSKPLYRKIAGRRVSVACWHIGSGGADGGSVTFTAPRRGRTLHTGDRVRDWDYCSIWRTAWRERKHRATVHHTRERLTVIPLTQKGAVYLDEYAKTWMMLGLLSAAELDDEDEVPGPFERPDLFVGRFGGGFGTYWPLRTQVRLVALTAADQTPPAGTVGYYSGSPDHAAAVVLSAAGRRLFFEVGRDETLSTNVARYLFQELE